MRQKLVPGAELDILSPEEATSIIARLLGDRGRPEARVRGDQEGLTDAAGLVTFELYRVPPGQSFRLHRLLVLAPGFTPAVPYNAAGAFLEVLRNDLPVDFVSLVAGASQLPLRLQWGASDGPYFENGDCLAIALTGTAAIAARNIIGRFEGNLDPLERVSVNAARGRGGDRRRALLPVGDAD